MGVPSHITLEFHENKKMILRQNLRNTKMTKFDSVTSYLTKISQVKDEFVAVGEVIPED